jgi:hypothetical protein
MVKRARRQRSLSHSQNSGELEDAPPKRARMTGANGKSFAQRMRKIQPIEISDSSDVMSQSDISPLISPHISESGTDNPSPLSHKSTERDLGAEGLAKEYDPGNPYSESGAEPKKSTASNSGKERSAGGSYAEQCIAAAKEDLNSSRLEHEEVTKRIEQGEIERRKLAEKIDDISRFIREVEKLGISVTGTLNVQES